jgi:hypothetical protein
MPTGGTGRQALWPLNLIKSMEIYKNQWKSISMYQILKESMKISENP